MSVQQGNRQEFIRNDLDDVEVHNLKYNMRLQNYYNSINNISDEFILLLDIDDESDTEYNDYDVENDHSDNECFDIDLDTYYNNLEENKEQILGNIFTTEECSIMKLTKLVEYMGYPDDAIEKIVTWTREAHLGGFKFNLSSKTRERNVKWMKRWLSIVMYLSKISKCSTQ